MFNGKDQNPLLDNDGLPAFGLIQPVHVGPAVKEMLKNAEAALQKVEGETNVTWETIFEPLDDINHKLHQVWSPVTHLLGTSNSEELRKAHEQVLGEMVSFGLRYSQSEALYKAYKKLRDSSAWKTFDSAKKRAIEINIRDAELSGISLTGEKKKRFNEISKELSQLSTDFSNHVLDSIKEFSLTLTSKDDVKGLPSSLLAQISQGYNQNNPGKATSTAEKGPWRLSLDYPCYGPFMKFSERRDLRETLYLAQITRASEGPHDNSPRLVKILNLRQELAQLLGFKTFAALSLAKKMAPSSDAVNKLLNDLRNASWDAAQKELKEVENLAVRKGLKDKLAHWDYSFYSEQLRAQKFDFSEEDLRPYFPLGHVLNGLFALVERIFAIKVKSADGDAPVWHKDVKFFKIFDDRNNQIAAFYLDPYSRPENKRGGAWMDDCLNRSRIANKLQLPVAYLVCNFPAPVGTQPSLLTFQDVRTLFHEFGHGLQHMLTTVDVPQVAGISGVEWDAVELASQFMENWCYHKPTLLGLSKHIETGKELPDDLFEKILAAKNFQAASHMLRQLRFAMTDLALHAEFNATGREAVNQLAVSIAARTAVLPLHPKDQSLCSFTHIFSGGYAAGYFSYKWAEVLSADAFSAFEEVGLDQPTKIRETGARYRNTILALGGSKHPMDVFKEFRGREPKIDALLNHSGLQGS